MDEGGRRRTRIGRDGGSGSCTRRGSSRNLRKYSRFHYGARSSVLARHRGTLPRRGRGGGCHCAPTGGLCCFDLRYGADAQDGEDQRRTQTSPRSRGCLCAGVSHAPARRLGRQFPLQLAYSPSTPHANTQHRFTPITDTSVSPNQGFEPGIAFINTPPLTGYPVEEVSSGLNSYMRCEFVLTTNNVGLRTLSKPPSQPAPCSSTSGRS